MTDKNIPTRNRLIVALDFPSAEQALRLVRMLGDQVCFYKVGLELFLSAQGRLLVDQLVNDGKQVFLDLKFFDVPRTVGAAVAQVRNMGVRFVSVHGHETMLKAAVANKGETMKILAVTVLTSMDYADLVDMGFPERVAVEQLVLSRARRALACGCDGVVSSGLEAAALRDELGEEIVVVTPGIRPVANEDDQKRTVDVRQAFTNGADHIVVGRPIHEASDPTAAVADIQQTISALFPAAQ